jgi:hypothetical protein
LDRNGKRRALPVEDDDDMGEQPASKRKARKDDGFGFEWPYPFWKILRNQMKKFIIPASDYDSDDSDKPVDDGFDAQMDIEREYEDRIEMAARRLAISNARGDQVQAGSIVGDWDIYGPDYLDLREVELRKSWKEGKRFDFRHYKNGTLSIMELNDDTLVSNMDATGALWLDDFEYDWHIPINVHQIASTKFGRTRLSRGGSMEGTLGTQRLE